MVLPNGDKHDHDDADMKTDDNEPLTTQSESLSLKVCNEQTFSEQQISLSISRRRRRRRFNGFSSGLCERLCGTGVAAAAANTSRIAGCYTTLSESRALLPAWPPD